MTQATVKKIRTLIRITERHISRAEKVAGEKTSRRSPFAGSGAKYYPALKKLAAK